MPASSAISAALRTEYQQLFDTCQIRPERRAEIDAVALKVIAGESRYRGVADPLRVPWYVVGVIHSLEANLRFDRHLHNGDPLTARTVQVPRGRPRDGSPPFTWEQSAADALAVEGYTQWSDWSIPGILFKWESYNGMGYRRFHPEVKSPYLWSYTNHYTRGKYVADGTWSATTVSRQAGAAAILRRLAERGAVDAKSQVTDPQLARALSKAGGALRFSGNAVAPGGVELQKFLNQFPGIFLREDGKLGEKSSDAYRQVFGQRLAGDPRGR
jgi:lysozyme family protein